MQMAEIFQHTVYGRFLITHIWEDIAKHPECFALIESELTPELIEHITNNVQVNEQYIRDMPIEKLVRPLITIELANGEIALIDGHHRALHFWRQGITVVPAFRLTEYQARLYRF